MQEQSDIGITVLTCSPGRSLREDQPFGLLELDVLLPGPCQLCRHGDGIQCLPGPRTRFLSWCSVDRVHSKIPSP